MAPQLTMLRSRKKTALLRLNMLVLAALFGFVNGYVAGQFATQTVGFAATQLPIEPTQAPIPMVDGQIIGRAINTECTEWSFIGGGTPYCAAPYTCVFGNNGGDVSSNYFDCDAPTGDRGTFWTTCHDYPQFGASAGDDRWCPSSAPVCGSQALVYAVGSTYIAWICGSSPYSQTATLVPPPPGQSPIIVNGLVTYANTAAPSTSTEIVTETLTQISQPSFYGFTPGSSGFSSTTSSGCASSANPARRCPSSRLPIGAIVGGIIGSLAMLALLIFFLWFFKHNYRQGKVQNNSSTTPDRDAATAAAFHDRQSEIAEIMATEPKTELAVNGGNKAPVNVHQTTFQGPSQLSAPPEYTTSPHPEVSYSGGHHTRTGNATLGADQLAFAMALPPCLELDGNPRSFMNPSEVGDGAYRPFQPP